MEIAVRMIVHAISSSLLPSSFVLNIPLESNQFNLVILFSVRQNNWLLK